MGLERPIIFKENSDLKEEENQPDNENNIGKQWAKNPLPKNLLRTKAHAVNHTSTDGHISNKPCQISSSLVFAAKRDGSQNIHPANRSAITKESARRGACPLPHTKSR